MCVYMYYSCARVLRLSPQELENLTHYCTHAENFLVIM